MQPLSMHLSLSFRPPFRAVIVVLCVFVASGCASPTGRLRSLAEQQGFEHRVVASDGFDLTVFENTLVGGERSVGDVLHVYLEGDGTPWMYRVLITPDPTPRRPLMLRLMALDASPAAYLGRPCYNGTAADAGCDNALWTSARYSSSVADSMANAIGVLLERHEFESVRLFGHSGGGTLALLIAARLPQTLDVITVAGNLDPDAWTAHHRYTPLHESLNPVREPPLDDAIGQWHLLGGDDTVVPPAITRAFIDSQANAVGALFPSFGHGCCWQRVWSGVLRAVDSGRASVLPGEVFSRGGRRASGRDDP